MHLLFPEGLALKALDWIRLVKLPLCLLVACSALWGYVLQMPSRDRTLMVLVTGVLLLACGAAGLNSVQERETDRLFVRTRNRPLATGRLPVGLALACSLLLIGGGLLLLTSTGPDLRPLFLGLAAVVLYNGVYTPLKQVTIFTLFPGGIAGAIPPLIGWTAAGGEIFSLQAGLLFTLLFLWQIPHYLLILLEHQQDYADQDGWPSLIRVMSATRLKQIAAMWIFACLAVTLMLSRLYAASSMGGQVAFLPMLAGMLVCGLILPVHQTRLGPTALSRIFNLSFFSSLLGITVFRLYAG